MEEKKKATHKQAHIDVDLIRLQMAKLRLSAYRISKTTEDKDMYPAKIAESNLSLILSSGGARVPRVQTLMSLGLILEIPWENLILD